MLSTDSPARSPFDSLEAPAAGSLLFGDFELRLDSWELLRGGQPVKLQQQPARVLARLALHTGVAVSREEIRRSIWGEESHLDFDLALNYCIRQIRRALEDSAEHPRFLATLPRVGYRFLAPVEIRRRELDTTAMEPEPATPPGPTPRKWGNAWQLSVAALVLLLALAGLVSLRSRGLKQEVPRVPDEAMRAYLAGQYFSARAESGQARKSFQQATLLAPAYAPAWAGLGHELLEDEKPEKDLAPLLETAERQALKLDPQLPLAHLNRAERLFRFKYDWAGAETEFRRTIELDPQQAEAHYEYARLLAARGRHGEAREQVDQALYLKPEEQLVRSRSPWFHYLARHYDEAIAQAQRQIDLAPGKTSETNPTQPALFWAFRTMTLAALAKGDQEGAFAAARAEAHWLGDPEPASLDEHWRYKERHFAQVGTPRPWYRVVPAIELGDRERALDLLLEQCRQRSDSMLAFLSVDPLYDSLRSLPRFRELLRCANQAS